MTSRRVLTLAYHYPPVGGAGVQRMAQLSRRLPELGWAQTVITGPGDPASRWRPRDETLEAAEVSPSSEDNPTSDVRPWRSDGPGAGESSRACRLAVVASRCRPRGGGCRLETGQDP